MGQTIKLRRSSVPGAKPTIENLPLGEIAINTNDGKAFLTKSGSQSHSVEEFLLTNTSNSGSLNLLGGINLIGTQIVTGSITITNGITGSANFETLINVPNLFSSSSFNTYTSSVNTYTGNTSTLIATKLDTSSFNTYTSSNDGKVNSLTSKTGSYATTGSNIFIGNQGVTGSVLILGSIYSYEEKLDVNAGTEVIALVLASSYSGVFFDYLIKGGYNLRAGTVTSVHDGTNVEYTEVGTNDIGDTSDVSLSVDINSGYLRLLATAETNNWTIKTIIRGI
jgi:hypothetical protein